MTEQKGPQQLALEAEFPSAQLDSVPKQGKNLTYVPAGEVIQRLNDVLGVTGWDWKLERVWRDELNPDWVIAFGSMTCTIDGKTSTKSGEGGVQVSLTRKDQTIVDLGDEFKGASSDAMKKAAQRFGVGLWLARSKDAREYEAPKPVRDAEAEGWESKERAEQWTKELNARVKAAPEAVQSEMRQFREDQNLIWPPTFDGYEAMRRKLDQLLHEHEQASADPKAQAPAEPAGARDAYEADPYELPSPSLSQSEVRVQPGKAIVNGQEVPTTGPQSMTLEQAEATGLVRIGTPESPESAETVPDTHSPTTEADSATTEATDAAKEMITEAFPGAVDVSPAHPDLVQVLHDYLSRLDSQADVRAWNAYAKTKEYPKDKATMTEAQVKQALDFLETL